MVVDAVDMQFNELNLKSHEMTCPLCGAEGGQLFHKDRQRCYLRCWHCMLVFVPQRFWLSAEEEKAIYDLHQNDARDAGYCRFLSRLSEPLLNRLGNKQRGLDFGCGPGPALSALLAPHGHQVERYDPIYCNDASVFSKTYDFICATEVVEHLREPGKVLPVMFKMLKPGGWLGIMTKLVKNQSAFRRWHYIRDLTHICFFCRDTFGYVAKRFNVEIEIIPPDVILLRKM